MTILFGIPSTVTLSRDTETRIEVTRWTTETIRRPRQEKRVAQEGNNNINQSKKKHSIQGHFSKNTSLNLRGINAPNIYFV